MNVQNGEEEKEKRSISQSSINSNPELKEKKVYFLRISLIIINIISLFSGFYIYHNRIYYLSSEYKFDYRKCLFIFVMLYSLGMIGTLIFSFLLAIFLKIFIFIVDLFTGESNPLIKNEEINSENSFRFINSHANQISLIPYAFTFFIIFTATLYLIGLPYSIFLLIFMNKNKYYSNSKDFALLYIFVIINAIGGFILFYILLIIVFAKRDGSFRQRRFFIDDNNLNNLRNEIKGAMDKAQK